MVASVHPNDHDGSHHVSYGPVPGSPTLTNPDMILPDYEVPDSPETHLPSPLEMWNDPNVAQLDFQLPPQNYGSRSIPPSTPIIYGNGTMLSDIGEVTEVESTVGSYRRTSSRYSTQTIDGETCASSNAIVNKAYQRRTKEKARGRSSSMDSTSTITTQDQRANILDFDDSVSVDDSNFQGDDEESMASSYVEGAAPRSAQIGISRRTQDVSEERYSTTYISERAEQILANAKLRLTAMEGNLTRARSSLTYSPISDGSTPSPRLERPGTSFQDSVPSNPTNHSRIKSEDGTRDLTKPTPFLQRSASALGSAGGYRQPWSMSRRHESASRPGHAAKKISHQPIDTTLEPLSEDDHDEKFDTPGGARSNTQLSNLLSPTFGSFLDRPLSRSASVAQMRDIQDQMQGLRGKISSLREQARVDSMKRRSLQSLRTPSPFTHSRWAPDFVETREVQESHPVEETLACPKNSGGQPSQSYDNPQYEPNSRDTPTQEHDRSIGNENDEGPLLHQNLEDVAGTATNLAVDLKPQVPVEDDLDDMRTENGDMEDGGDLEPENEYVDDAEDVPDWESESGESLYHDTHQHQLSHEDREDAFDYEHFFLHSAMGSMSRQRSRRSGSFESDFSEDSVETTRGPVGSPSKKRRSFDTIASEDSFATATEGRASRSSEFQDDAGDEDITITYDGMYSEAPGRQNRHRNAVSEDIRCADKTRQRPNSVVYRPSSATPASRLNRPSIASFESAGTNRSFPLMNKTNLNGGIVTPGDSPDPLLRQMSESLMNDTASVCDKDSGQGQSATRIQNISKEDQIAVERLVASIGKCVLGLSEGSRASSDARLYRRRIDAARQILEGCDDVS